LNILLDLGSNQYGQCGLGENGKSSSDIVTWKKIPTVLSIRDVSCGSDFSAMCSTEGRVYTCGHPEYSQLGHGSNGEYFKEGARCVQFSHVMRPQVIRRFYMKNNSTKVTKEIPADLVTIRSVSCGKNHMLALEDWGNGGNRYADQFYCSYW